jgi:hypothetical protein
MLDYATFSALRLRHVFPSEVLESSRFCSAVDPEKPSFDIEYIGGLWDTEMIDGVTLWFPKRDGSKVAVVELSAGKYVGSIAEKEKPAPDMGPDPSWVSNADRVLEALELPRMGASEAAVRALDSGRAWSHPIPDSVAPGILEIPHADPRLKRARSSLFFATAGPDVYHVAATVHAAEGLLNLEIRRPDLIRRNELQSDFTYEMLLGLQYDGWPR